MKYLASFAAGVVAAVLAAVIFALFSDGISYAELGWGGYLAVDLEAAPLFLVVLMAAFGFGFFGTLRQASR
jgi:hypothetical protein